MTTSGESPLLDPVNRPTLTVEQAAQVMQLGRSAAYEMIRQGRIPVVRLSPRCYRVPTQRLMVEVLGMDPGPAEPYAVENQPGPGGGSDDSG